MVEAPERYKRAIRRVVEEYGMPEPLARSKVEKIWPRGWISPAEWFQRGRALRNMCLTWRNKQEAKKCQ